LAAFMSRRTRWVPPGSFGGPSESASGDRRPSPGRREPSQSPLFQKIRSGNRLDVGNGGQHAHGRRRSSSYRAASGTTRQDSRFHRAGAPPPPVAMVKPSSGRGARRGARSACRASRSNRGVRPVAVHARPFIATTFWRSAGRRVEELTERVFNRKVVEALKHDGIRGKVSQRQLRLWVHRDEVGLPVISLTVAGFRSGRIEPAPRASRPL